MYAHLKSAKEYSLKEAQGKQKEKDSFESLNNYLLDQ